MMMLDSGTVRSFASSRSTGNLPIGQMALNAAPGLGVGEVDDVGLERGVVLVEGDQRLLTEGGERVEIELERHGSIPLVIAYCNWLQRRQRDRPRSNRRSVAARLQAAYEAVVAKRKTPRR